MEKSNEDQKNYGSDLKIILMGNISTGKTSIIDRYIKNTFDEKIKATIMPDFSYKIMKRDDTFYRLQFWDIPGQDHNPNLTSIFCRNCQGIIFCCDVKVKKSRDDILKWKKSLESFIDIKNIPIILLENKCDLLGNEEKYNENIEDLKNFSENNKFSGFFRTSALNGYNIEKAIEFLVNNILTNLDEEANNISPKDSMLANKLESKNNPKNKKCC